MPRLMVLFNHTLTPAQEHDARSSLGVERIVLPPSGIQRLWSQVPPETGDLSGYLAPVMEWLGSASAAGDFVLVQGEFGATCMVAGWCLERGLVPVYSTTRREAEEKRLPDGSVQVRHRFAHVRFRRYASCPRAASRRAGKTGLVCEGFSLPDPPEEWFIRPDGENAAGSIHGVGHTVRVWLHGQVLARELGRPEWQRQALHQAALWHDIGRVDDGIDPLHGSRSAGRVIGLGLHTGLDERVREAALFAVTYHSLPDRTGEEAARLRAGGCELLDVLRLFKDADGLDRVRLGDLDPAFLRHAEARARVARAWELYEEWN